jgi:hypothetical protein
VIGNQAMLQPDLVHPNAAGAAKIAGNIWPYLQPLAAGAVGQIVRTRFPYEHRAAGQDLGVPPQLRRESIGVGFNSASR